MSMKMHDFATPALWTAGRPPGSATRQRRAFLLVHARPLRSHSRVSEAHPGNLGCPRVGIPAKRPTGILGTSPRMTLRGTRLIRRICTRALLTNSRNSNCLQQNRPENRSLDPTLSVPWNTHFIHLAGGQSRNCSTARDRTQMLPRHRRPSAGDAGSANLPSLPVVPQGAAQLTRGIPRPRALHLLRRPTRLPKPLA